MSDTRTTSNDIILELKGLKKSFEGIIAVDGIDLQIDATEITGIIGPNGAGKSTLINLISGHHAPTAGTVRFTGEDVTDISEHGRAQKGIVKSFQIPQVYNELTTIENVYASLITRDGRNISLFSSIRTDEELKAEAISLLSQFGIDEYQDTEVENLPHGVRKVLDVAMAVALEPNLIMLDEPTSGVGTEQRDELMETVIGATKQAGAAIVFVEHDMELVAEYSDRVVAMHNGTLLREGDPDAVLSSAEVKRHIKEEGA